MKNFFGIIFCFIFLHSGFTQRDLVKNLENFDRRKIHFGFSLGLNQGDYFIRHNNRIEKNILGIEVIRQPGFNINMVSELHFLKYCGLRFNPGLSLTSRMIQYRILESSGQPSFTSKQVEATYIEFPLLLKFRSARVNNFAAYMLAGGHFNLDLANQEKTDNKQNSGDEIVIKTKRNNYGYTVGTGMDFFMEFYKFSLEFKYNVGLNNVFIQDNSRYSNPIEILKPRMFIISISFEG